MGRVKQQGSIRGFAALEGDWDWDRSEERDLREDGVEVACADENDVLHVECERFGVEWCTR